MARRKKKDQGIIEKLLKKADEAKKTGIGLSKAAREQAQIHGKRLREEGSKKVGQGRGVARNIISSSQENLNTLEKLGKLRKSGIITEKEFQAKKKKILERI